MWQSRPVIMTDWDGVAGTVPVGTSSPAGQTSDIQYHIITTRFSRWKPPPPPVTLPTGSADSGWCVCAKGNPILNWIKCQIFQFALMRSQNKRPAWAWHHDRNVRIWSNRPLFLSSLCHTDVLKHKVLNDWFPCFCFLNIACCDGQEELKLS